MKGHPWRRSISALAPLPMAPMCAASMIGAGVSADRDGGDPGMASKQQITVLYDAFGKVTAMKKDWGFAALVEIGGRRILFDTGNNPEVFAQNVKAADVDLEKLDFVVMSHRHGDHMGGMTYLLGKNPSVRIYAPQEGFGVYGASLPGSFYRKDESLPTEMRYYDGKPPEVLRFGAAWPEANITLIDKTTEGTVIGDPHAGGDRVDRRLLAFGHRGDCRRGGRDRSAYSFRGWRVPPSRGGEGGDREGRDGSA
jgi:hypothetical protein